MQQKNFSKSEIAAHYNEFHDLYEKWSGSGHGGYHFGIMKKWTDLFSNDRMVFNMSNKIISHIPKKENQVILEAGCGSAYVGQLVINARENASVIGITLSERQAHTANAREKKVKKAPNVRVGNFEKTVFADETFDVVIFIDSLCHGTGPAKKAAVEETSRLLKPGGTLIFADVFLKEVPKLGDKWYHFINTKVFDLWKVSQWTEEKQWKKILSQNQIMIVTDENMTWKIVPSVLHLFFIKFPTSVIAYIIGRGDKKEMQYLFTAAIFAPLVGLHPYFRYKIITAKKIHNV